MRFYGNHGAASMLKITLHAPQPVYLLRGPQGVGKQTLALRFARSLLCLGSGAVDCTCDSCKKFSAGLHPDLVLPVGENGLKKENALDIRNESQHSPLVSKRKVFLIDDADSMTPEGQNALLKTLEDGREWNTFLLIDHSGRVLPTIESRAFTVQFLPATESEMMEYLSEETLEPQVLDLIISMAAGRVGRAKAMLADERFNNLSATILGLLKTGNLGQLSLLERFHLLKENDTESFYEICPDYVPELIMAFRAYFLDCLLVRLGGRATVFRSFGTALPSLSPAEVGKLTTIIDGYARTLQKGNKNDFFDFVRTLGKSYEEGMRLAVS